MYVQINEQLKINIMMITEQQYLEALSIITKYSNQMKKQSEELLRLDGIKKTPNQIYHDWDTYFPSMSIRLWNILKSNFEHKKICDITRKEFLSTRFAGKKSWTELCDLTGNKW